MNKVTEKIQAEVFVGYVCFWSEEWQALTHVVYGHMTAALDRQGMEQNAPILSLLAGHSSGTGCLPMQPPSWGTLSLQPRKWPD